MGFEDYNLTPCIKDSISVLKISKWEHFNHKKSNKFRFQGKWTSHYVIVMQFAK